MNTIKVKKYSDVIEEYTASGAILPGMLLEYTTTGAVKAHSQAGKNTFKMFALEDELQGKGINDAYVNNDKVQAWIPYRGDEVLALLSDGENVVIGDLLESDGFGRLRKIRRSAESWESADANPGGGSHSIFTEHCVAVCIEAQDLSALDGSNSSLESNSQHIKVKIL